MSGPIRHANITDTALDLANFNRMVDYVNMLANMAVDQNMTISRGPPVFMLGVRSGSTTMSYSDWAFGFSISGAVVTVNAGKVRHGTRTPISVAGVDITIAADQTWVFVSYPYGGGAASIMSSTTEPVDTEDTHNRALYLVTLAGEGEEAVASIEPRDISHLGDIWLPGNVG